MPASGWCSVDDGQFPCLATPFENRERWGSRFGGETREFQTWASPPTGIRIGRYPVELSFGRKGKSGRIIGGQVSADPGNRNGAINYTYDNVGNRKTLTSTLAPVGAMNYSYDADDRLAADTYDPDGNTINSNGIANTYDFENHLVTHGGVTMVYDGDGNRVSETVSGVTTNYLVDMQNPTGYAQVVDELQNGSVTKSYSFGLERISQNWQPTAGNWQLSFYGYDGHGSVRQLTNSTGAVTDTYDYDAFGNLINSTGSTPNVYLFAGEAYDAALGLYYNRARYLNTATGRFWSMDTEEGDTESPASLHLYLYAGADPVDRFDRSGNDFTLAETNEALGTISKLSSMTMRVMRIMDTVSSVADTVNSVVGIFNLVSAPSMTAFWEDAVNTAKTEFSGAEVIENLERNVEAVVSRASVPWSAWLLVNGPKINGLVLYMPNVGLLPKIPLLPTGIRIGRYPVEISFGGTGTPGRIIGVGVDAPGLGGANDNQIWRVDFHTFHAYGCSDYRSKGDIAAWPDFPFHYHVLDPMEQ